MELPASGLDRELALLSLVHLLRCPELLQAYADPVEKTGLFKPWPDLQFIWDTVTAYWQRYQKPIPKQLVIRDLQERLSSGLLQAPSPDVLQTVSTIFQLQKEELSETYAADVLKEALSTVLRHNLRLQLDTVGSEDIPQILESAGRQYTATLSAKPRFVKPLRNLSSNLLSAGKDPIGIPWLDGVLGGGTGAGDMLGFVIPSKCGKTTLALQICRACVLMKRRVDYATFEQDEKGDITLRVCVLSSNGTRTEWQRFSDALSVAHEQELVAGLPEGTLTSQVEANKYQYISADTAQRLAANEKDWDKYFTMIDFTKPDVKIPNIPALFAYTDELTEICKIPPYMLVLDWWGLLSNRMMSLQNFRDSQAMRIFRMTQLNLLKTYTQASGRRTVVFHQMAGAEAKKGSNHRPSSFAGMEDSTFPLAFDSCMSAGTKDAQNCIKLLSDALRKGLSGMVTLQIDGEHCALEQVTGVTRMNTTGQGPNQADLFAGHSDGSGWSSQEEQ